MARNTDLECQGAGPGNLLVILHTLGFENHWVTAVGQGHDVMLAMSSHPFPFPVPNSTS